MNNLIEIIENRFHNRNEVEIPLIRGDKYFKAKLCKDGIEVDNLRTQPFLPWDVFIKTVELLEVKGGTARKGDAMNCKLGERGLEFDTIEGYIASGVYGKEVGDSVFRRITPICNILIWAGLCENGKGELKLI